MNSIFCHIVLLCFAFQEVYTQTCVAIHTQDSMLLKEVRILHENHEVTTNIEGEKVCFEYDQNKKYTIYAIGYSTQKLKQTDIQNGQIILNPINRSLKSVEVLGQEQKNTFQTALLRDVEGTTVYAAKKTNKVTPDQLVTNKGSQVARQVFAGVSGINVWETDCAGLQLAIGGRGLSPHRTANFSTRQNGYNIAADALGYPETYYAPPLLAIQDIQLVRGSGALQYGSQFGGMLNFKMKQGNTEKQVQVHLNQGTGSNKFLNSFVSASGQIKKWQHFTYAQRRSSDCFRPNSELEAYWVGHHSIIHLSELSKLKVDYSYLYYLAHQPGGLTDAAFQDDPTQSIRQRNWFRVNWNLAALTFEHRDQKSNLFTAQAFGLLGSRKSVGELGQINRADPLGDRNLIVGDFKNLGLETKYLMRKSIKQKPLNVLVGFRAYLGETIGRQGFANDAVQASFTFLDDRKIENDYRYPSLNLALFNESVYYLSEQTKLTLGVRFERINTQANGSFNASIYHPLTGALLLELDSVEQRGLFRNVVLFGLGFSHLIGKEKELYISFTQNYRAVNFNDLRVVNPNFKIDENLKDEKGFSVDVGLRSKRVKNTAFDLSAFALFYQDKLGVTLSVDSQTNAVHQLRTNISNAINTGIEGYIEHYVVNSTNTTLSIFLNATATFSHYTGNNVPAVKGNKVEYTPLLNLRSGIKLGYHQLKAQLQVSHTSDQYSDATNADLVANATVGLIPSYTTVDLNTSYTFKKIELSAGVNNLLNAHYFTTRATGYPGPGILPANFRNFYFSVGYSF